jgi:hypothetical protein
LRTDITYRSPLAESRKYFIQVARLSSGNWEDLQDRRFKADRYNRGRSPKTKAKRTTSDDIRMEFGLHKCAKILLTKAN